MTDVDAKRKMNFERTFLSNHIKKYYRILDGIPATGDVQMDKVHYCERFTELMIDLTAQLPTRRFFNTGRIFHPYLLVCLLNLCRNVLKWDAALVLKSSLQLHGTFSVFQSETNHE